MPSITAFADQIIAKLVADLQSGYQCTCSVTNGSPDQAPDFVIKMVGIGSTKPPKLVGIARFDFDPDGSVEVRSVGTPNCLSQRVRFHRFKDPKFGDIEAELIRDIAEMCLHLDRARPKMW